jgi:hypothetical protein
MLELAAAQMEKGVFELRLEGEGPRWASWITGLGPIRGRIFALVLVILAAGLNLTTAPAAFFFEQGWATSTLHALNIQASVKWAIAGLGFVIWALAFGIRREELRLVFDRSAAHMAYRYRPQWNLAAVDQGQATFDNIRRIEVFGPAREPQTSFGFIEIEIFDAEEKREKLFRFKLLSEDQLKIYPANLARITGREPKGDWVDPDSTPLSP